MLQKQTIFITDGYILIIYTLIIFLRKQNKVNSLLITLYTKIKLTAASSSKPSKKLYTRKIGTVVRTNNVILS